MANKNEHLKAATSPEIIPLVEFEIFFIILKEYITFRYDKIKSGFKEYVDVVLRFFEEISEKGYCMSIQCKLKSNKCQ